MQTVWAPTLNDDHRDQPGEQRHQLATNMSNELATTDSTAFELIQRQAKMLSASTLIPKEFQGNMANCAIGLEIANRLKCSPFMVIQNIDIINGRPSFRAQFLIAMVNASGRFSPLQFRFEGKGETRSCQAFAKSRETGELCEGPVVTWAMAKAEGWTNKSGSKWMTLPDLMFTYRAGAFFARIYAPDITLGMATSEEVHDMTAMRDVTPSTASFKLPEVAAIEEDETAETEGERNA